MKKKIQNEIVVYHNQNDINNNGNKNSGSNTGTGGLCCYRYERFISFLASVLQHKERDTILKSLCWPYYADPTPTRRQSRDF